MQIFFAINIGDDKKQSHHTKRRHSKIYDIPAHQWSENICQVSQRSHISIDKNVKITIRLIRFIIWLISKYRLTLVSYVLCLVSYVLCLPTAHYSQSYNQTISSYMAAEPIDLVLQKIWVQYQKRYNWMFYYLSTKRKG